MQEIKFTPENIKQLKSNEVFVFGSNEQGAHGDGAALHAMNNFGAVYGVGFGMKGKTFAIPTKDWRVKVLSLDIIEFYIKRFIEFAKMYKGNIFYVTKIGCSLAGYTPEQIAPLFKECLDMDNIILPEEFYNIIKNI